MRNEKKRESEISMLKTIALEEHFSAPHLAAKIDPALVSARGFRPRKVAPDRNPIAMLADIGEQRLKQMDDHGIDIQVLSHSGPGCDLVAGAQGIEHAKAINDYLASKIALHPTRFRGFAHLPLLEPKGAVGELTRAVRELKFVGAMVDGTTNGLFLDDPIYDDLLSCAEELDVPIYLHPALAPAAIRDIYYSRLPSGTDRVLETGGWGWHSETAIHVLRLVVSGTLQKHPRLKLIIGHMGEMIPVMLARFDEMFAQDIEHLNEPISKTITERVWITTSGIFTQTPLRAALETFGIDRIMFSVDYPFSKNESAKAFLDSIELPKDQMEKLAHANARALLKI
jgi:predicted TIM-barrel fold metal-dependent hydrolase